MLSHFVISAHVTLRSCDSELADTMVVEPILVVSIQITSHETSADLPIPRPDDVAILNVSKSIFPLLERMWSRSVSSTSRCHTRGPSKCSRGVPGFPHGNANRTKASGSSLICWLHSVAMSFCSSCGENMGVCNGTLDYPHLRLFKRGGDADCLVDLYADRLTRHPSVGVLQYVQRRLRIPCQRRRAQHPGHLGLGLCAPALLRILGHLVTADQRPILGRGHVQRKRQRV